MTLSPDDVGGPVTLSDDDAAYLVSVLRELNRQQPISTQDLIDALRSRNAR